MRQCRHEVDVLLHGIVRGCASDFVPSVVLRAAHEVQCARTLVVGVACRSLFVERVKTEQRNIVRALGEAVDVQLGLFESSLKIGHIPLSRAGSTAWFQSTASEIKWRARDRCARYRSGRLPWTAGPETDTTVQR